MEQKKLGFGLMRLPKRTDGSIDQKLLKQMIDLYLENGFSYFDTAFTYDNGASERAIKEALVDRYPRQAYTLATKLNAWLGCQDEESAKQEFYTSLERTGAGYFDYYLLHGLQADNYKLYDRYHIWEFLKEQKEKGLIRRLGFSFHADPKLLEELLKQHPEMDFVQLQLNYADWNNSVVQAKENHAVACRYQKPIIVMEPVKGGLLADPPKTVKEILEKAEPKASFASWAIRFSASLEGVQTVLSGMSDLAQLQDNISYMKEFRPLNEQELTVIEAARNALEETSLIPCTACHYCANGCPAQIPIPDLFDIMNLYNTYGDLATAKHHYMMHTKVGGKASDCLQCGKCEFTCPQQLKIRDLLQNVAKALE